MAVEPLPDEKNRLVFQYASKRGRYIRAFLRQLLAFAAAVGAYFAIGIAAQRAEIDPRVVDVGKLVAVILGGLLVIRGAWFLFLAFTRPTEDMRFYTRGFIWQRGKETYKYPYPEVVRYRESGRGLYVGMRPIVQWGAHVIEMRDGKVFRVKPYHGSLRRFADRVRAPIAHVTAVQIGQKLREGRSVQLHRKLIVYPTGIEIGRREIGWGEMGVAIKGNRLIIRRADRKRNKMVRVKSFWIPAVDNVGGFNDLAQGTIRNHRERRAAPAAAAPRLT
ncbi:MAG: hypothetical protein U0670_24140 [Anaerolineae bacterium]